MEFTEACDHSFNSSLLGSDLIFNTFFFVKFVIDRKFNTKNQIIRTFDHCFIAEKGMDYMKVKN